MTRLTTVEELKAAISEVWPAMQRRDGSLVGVVDEAALRLIWSRVEPLGLEHEQVTAKLGHERLNWRRERRPQPAEIMDWLREAGRKPGGRKAKPSGFFWCRSRQRHLSPDELIDQFDDARRQAETAGTLGFARAYRDMSEVLRFYYPHAPHPGDWEPLAHNLERLGRQQPPSRHQDASRSAVAGRIASTHRKGA